MKAREYDRFGKRFSGGMTIYPYQLSLGITFRYYPCVFSPGIRIHIGMFKFWFAVRVHDRGD